MHALQAVILGIVEGITEFLPISSTGHMILASKLLSIPETDFVKSFEIIIQLGAILAVVCYRGLMLRSWELLKRIIVAFIPTGIIGLALYSVVKHYLLGSTSVVIWSLLLGGIALIAFEKMHKEKDAHIEDLEKITYKQAFIVGLFQSIAIIPGVSRSAATIVGGMLTGIKRTAIVEFSFLLAIPTMAAATGLDILKNREMLMSADKGLLIIGLIASFVSALLTIKWLLAFVKKHTFVPFGIYRIIIALAFLVLL
jgi:undecaprenyl-diphosphatase